ncbi:hypothetical protein SAMN04488530_1233 [Asaccharospora irregularis DSM 2635]|uniref:Uncharacterized protein n=1 Tax=Asaccharospora irregularis DSM 2635 TaxID=1121321 RepID=A0A1M5QP86_9FIRM|nr:hypothetical protein [Asaccharospora irregularis]SHH15932.1 hypothetical protein SAMN04488530_1233 [Asaccharospora irregularis DSM 2635]
MPAVIKAPSIKNITIATISLAPCSPKAVPPIGNTFKVDSSSITADIKSATPIIICIFFSSVLAITPAPRYEPTTAAAIKDTKVIGSTFVACINIIASHKTGSVQATLSVAGICLSVILLLKALNKNTVGANAPIPNVSKKLVEKPINAGFQAFSFSNLPFFFADI